MKKQQILNHLFQKYIHNQCLPEEVDQLMDLLQDDEQSTLVNELIEVHISTAHKDETLGSDPQLKARLNERLFAILQTQEQVKRVVSIRKSNRYWVFSAAAALIIIVLGMWFFKSDSGLRNPETVQTESQPIIAPDHNKATITLSNGEIVALETYTDGLLATQQGIQILKSGDGVIVYQGDNNTNPEAIGYNTLNNPRGSKVIRMTLSDGSNVWLNAGSSIRYPVSFRENHRNVVITGEAYFEVEHDPEKPFTVEGPEVDITVLGTSFNVNTYRDDNATRITLAEGSVRVNHAGVEKILKPNEQALIQSSYIKILQKIDLNKVMAWKDGWFEFANMSLPTIMKQLSRWYDIEVEFETQPAGEKFGGRISRDMPLSQVLKLLELSGVAFKVDGRTVTVRQLN